MAYLPLIEALKQMPEGKEKSILEVYSLSYPNLARIGFDAASNGNVHNWTIENQLPTSAPRNVGSDFTDDYGDVQPHAETVKLYGGVVKLDEFVTDTMPSVVQTQKAMQIKSKAQLAAKDMFEATGGTSAVGVDGYLARPTWAGQTVAVGGASTEALLDEGLDKVTIIPGSSFFFTTQSQGRAIKKLGRDTKQTLNFGGDDFGKWGATYEGIPIIPLFDGKGNDLFTTGNQKYYLVTFGPQMFHGIQNLDMRAKQLSADNWDYFRIKHYMSFVAESLRCFCVFTGCTD